MEQPCPFDVLGVSTEASEKTICSAWRRLSLDCHPDKRPGDPAAKAKFTALTEAKASLLDPALRAKALDARTRRRQASATPISVLRARRAAAAAAKSAAGASARRGAAAADAGAEKRRRNDEEEKAKEKARHAEFLATEKARLAESQARRASQIFFRHLERLESKKDVWKPPSPPRAPFSKVPAEPTNFQAGGRQASMPKVRVLQPARAEVAPPSAGSARGFDEAQHARNRLGDEPHRPPPESERPAEASISRSHIQVPREMPHPRSLPATVSEASIAAETGAAPGEAKAILQVLLTLRRFGGEAPLSRLGGKPKQLRALLGRYPEIFDVFLPSGLASLGSECVETWARLRGELVAARGVDLACPAAAAALGASAAGSCRMASRRSSRATVLELAGGIDGDSAGKRPRGVAGASEPGVTWGRKRSFGELQQGRFVCVVVSSDEENASDATAGASSSDEDAADGASPTSSLEEAFAHCRGAWQLDGGGAGRRALFLLPAGGLGALRPDHAALLFSYDTGTKVLYEFIPDTGSCKPLWTPAEPAVNAAIWTVLPLPPEVNAGGMPMVVSAESEAPCGSSGQEISET